jgi:hypothetical protein
MPYVSIQEFLIFTAEHSSLLGVSRLMAARGVDLNGSHVPARQASHPIDGIHPTLRMSVGKLRFGLVCQAHVAAFTWVSDAASPQHLPNTIATPNGRLTNQLLLDACIR